MTRYAARTEVAPDRSRQEIERTLTRYGASAFAYGWEGDRAMIAFKAHGRQLRIMLPLPSETDRAYTRTPTGRPRTGAAAKDAWNQDVRQRWRALALIVKAKLEAVTAGIVTFEDEFAMHTVLPDGSTVAEHVRPAIDLAYKHHVMPELIPTYNERPALPRGSS